MKLSETHEDISELVWKKFGSRNFIPSWSKFCEHVLFSLIFGMNGNCILAYSQEMDSQNFRIQQKVTYWTYGQKF